MLHADSDCGSSDSDASKLSDDDVFFSDGGTVPERPSTTSLASVSEEVLTPGLCAAEAHSNSRTECFE